ncbi:MAG TPA: small ribosomal subunit Rsm22 family protein [Bdellovibrionota bacterium]|jgi:hypothetical protein
MFYLREEFLFPSELDQTLYSALKKLGHQKDLGGTLRRLWEKLAKGRGQVREGEEHYSFSRDEARAYSSYYLPSNCLKPALVLEESFLLGTDPMPGQEAHWLDLGTGPGTAYWGVAWWCRARGKKLWFTGWDQSPAFTGIAGDLVAAASWSAPAKFLSGKEEPAELIRRLKPTHVSMMNAVAEIYPDCKRRTAEVGKIVRALRDLERSDGRPRFLLLIEPGSRESSRELAQLKDELQAGNLGKVMLPCLDDRICGALADPKDWCHEEAACKFPAWLNELGAEAGLRKESLLFSYAWIRAGEPDPAPACLRIVSQRLERKGQVECRICTKEGKRAVRVQRSKANEQNEFFFGLARGDLWKSAEIGEKGDLVRADPATAQVPHSLFANT